MTWVIVAVCVASAALAANQLHEMILRHRLERMKQAAAREIAEAMRQHFERDQKK